MSIALNPGEEPVPGYVLESRLGRGGFGEVWKAIAPGGIPVALKFIEVDGGAARVEERALRIVCRLRHPHLLEMHWAQRIDDRLVIATSLCNGNLRNRFKACVKRGLPGIPHDELLTYIDQTAQALDYLNEPQHQDEKGNLVGIQHRDIKPANIFLLSGSAKVADFGLAKILQETSSQHSGSMTPHYAPPEMFHGKVSARSDQYSLAVTYYELRTGRLPFAGESITQLMYNIVNNSPELDLLPEDERAIVGRALSKNPDDRWQSCFAFVQALRTVLPFPTQLAETVGSKPTHVLARIEPVVGESDKAPLQSPAQPQQKQVERPSPRWYSSPLLFGFGGLIALSVAAAIAWKLYSPVPNPEPKPKPVLDDSPAFLSAPFDAETAKLAQEQWANYLSMESPDLTNSIGMRLRLIPPGEYDMGSQETVEELEERFGRDGVTFESTFARELPAHRVRISNPFFVGVHEVTVGQFRQFTEQSGYKTDAERDEVGGAGYDRRENALEARSTRYNWKLTGIAQTDTHPVVNVTWHDAEAFVRWLSDKENRKYRLLTEAEWEYACRAGTRTLYHNGDVEVALVRVGNVADRNAQSELSDVTPTKKAKRRSPIRFLIAVDGHVFTAPVGQFEPSAFGLYDMHGNVMEWCSDWYSPDYYEGSPSVDPTGPIGPLETRIIRGGSWLTGGSGCRSSARSRSIPQARRLNTGFRIAAEVTESQAL